MSQFDTWLLIYGREKAKLMVASKTAIDLLAIVQTSLDRAIFLYNFIREAR